jgi:hypothetical protein
MAQSVVLRARGIHSFKNQLSELPEGALEEALNVVIDRDGVVEPRRGFKQYTENTFLDQPKQILNYKDRLLVHKGTSIAYENDTLDGTFTDFAGSYTEASAGRRIRGIESNGNFYFTTSSGIKKISALTSADFTSASGFITDAGGVKALDVTASIDTATPGFLSPLSKVAYRVVWGITDNNDNLILGSPSSRTVIENQDGVNSATVELSFAVPTDVTNTNFFYQVYRTGVVTGANLSALDTLDPGDEMNLIFEDFVTSGELSGGTVTVSDITPEDFRANGASLYTNPVSGDGILQANEPPPFAEDIETYKGYTFYANTSTRQQLSISQLSINDLVSGTSKLFVTDGTTTREYTYIGTNESYDVDFTGTTKANLDGNYVAFVSAKDEFLYKVWFDNTGTTAEPTLAGSISIPIDITGTADVPADLAAKFEIEVLNATNAFNFSGAGASRTMSCANNGAVTVAPTETIGGSFSITADGAGTGENAASNEIFLPRVPAINENGPSTSQQLDQASRSLVRVLNEDSLGLVNAFYLSGFNDVPGQFLLQQRDLTGAQFSFYTDSTSTSGEFNPALGVQSVNEDDVQSNNEVRPNRLFYSKFQQPEAVPTLNFLDIGPRDREIQRIVALRDSLFIFKEDGIYRLSGDVAPFSIAPFDFSLTLQAADTAIVLNNQVHAFTTQGVVQVTDTGVNVISRDIENLLLNITRENFAFNTASFAISYETDRSYLLFTVSDDTDTTATQCFRYNSFTNTWVRWDLEKTCGLVNTRDNKIYLGAADINIIEQERKGLTRVDYADREFETQVVANGVNGRFITLPNLTNIEVGDALLQTQRLTISQFNRLLNQLDGDPGVSDSDYFSTLGAFAGDNLRNSVNSLAAKLDLDAGVGDTDYGASITGTAGFVATQSDFNIIVNKLNADSGVFFVDYDESVDTNPREGVIVSIPEDQTNTVELNFAFPYIEGEVTHFKAINTKVTYAPQVLGNPTTHKQVREGTFLFENNNFTQATVGYKSDLSPFIESISFSGDGVGDWGQFNWGGTNWGGISGAKPLRTLVPLQKQRCRFIQPEYRHKVAFEKWSLFGIGLEFREFSIRAYR